MSFRFNLFPDRHSEPAAQADEEAEVVHPAALLTRKAFSAAKPPLIGHADIGPELACNIVAQPKSRIDIGQPASEFLFSRTVRAVISLCSVENTDADRPAAERHIVVPRLP